MQFIIKKFAKIYENEDQRKFAVRFQFGIPKIRDHVFSKNEDRKAFDDFFVPVIHNIEETNFAKEKCVEIIKKYQEKIERHSQEFIKTGTIDENISFSLNMFFKDFFIRGKMAIDNTIRLADFLGFKIAFFFADDKKFQDSFEKLSDNDHDALIRLAQMLRDDRKGWLKYFQDMRNKIEHHGFQYPGPSYSLSEDKTIINAHFPRIEKSFDVQDSLQRVWNNVFELCEDIIVLLLATKIRSPYAIKNIPIIQEDKKLPLRYEIDFLPNQKFLERFKR